MFQSKCKLCTEEFTKEQRIPKMLPCGHSFCLPCCSDLIQFLKSCPICDTNAPENFHALPTNHALLESTTPPLEDTESKKTKLLSELEEKEKRVKKLQDVANKLDQIINSSKDKVQSLREVNYHGEEDAHFELAMNFKSMEERLWKLDLALYCCYSPRIKANFVLGSYPTKEKFLHDVSGSSKSKLWYKQLFMSKAYNIM